ncbi:serine/threonine protein kinase [Pyxidicoccus fallax]|uniref:Serine/threonine protein kinase n=1 Tax=Pyxidicoccus fallax TaxID=394095 RepID=A0A848LCY1_9BACT|nr:serine/threonine-protein kinase [Pyxidicoccus fallax]NMO16849.1 serine/threonine protein kinase [Pyxidicoccus fallax]NPC84171.1 serine/threonine protein kinase [Pyxidicoccus fallax]
MAPGGEESLYGEELGAGALVGRWVVERVHYRGPMSTLYRAKDLHTGAPAALKVMHAQVAATPTALRRFRREAATLQRLSHPNIVAVLGHGELPDGRPFISMEWLEGRDLAAELGARGPFTADEALEVVEQVGAALRVAHGAGVVHRDLKAQNVVRLSGPGEALLVKLVDFGVAKGLTPEAPGASTLTHTGVALGTPLSMAPEQIRGEPPDARTDLYALGVLLFQLVTGQPPFLGATRHEVEEQHLHAPPPRPGERAPVPAALDAVVLRCLGKRREDRYPDVDALLEELRAAVRGGRAPARAGHAVALYAEARLTGSPTAEAMRRMDALLERAAVVAREAGLEVRVEGSGCLLALAALPEDVGHERALRARVLTAALKLVEGASASRDVPSVALAITVHVDRLPAAEEAGSLLRLLEWVSESPGGGLVATGAALKELDAAFLTEPGAGLGLSRVTGLR